MAVNTKSSDESCTLVCTTPAVPCMSKKKNELYLKTPQNVQVVSCHVIYIACIDRLHTLITSLSSSISAGVWARFISDFVALFRHRATMHHGICKRTRPTGCVTKPLKFHPTSDSRNGSYSPIGYRSPLGISYISQRRL